MAVIIDTRQEWRKQFGELMGDHVRRMDNVLRIQAGANRLVKIPVANGLAYYAVHHFYPLTLEQIPAGDNWHASTAMLQGLQASDLAEGGYGVNMRKVRRPKRVSKPMPAPQPRPFDRLDRTQVVLIDINGGVVHQVRTNIPALKNVRFVFHVNETDDLSQDTKPTKIPAAGSGAFIYAVDAIDPALLTAEQVKSIQRASDRYLKSRADPKR